MISVSTEGLSRFSVGGATPSRMASRQKIASTEDEGKARSLMTVSYRNRMLLQLIWVVLAFVLPVFNGAAGLIPLFFPSILIKCRGVLSAMKGQSV